MIEEEAQVIDVDGDKLILQAQTQSACGSCSANKGCGTSLLAKVIGRKFTRFRAQNNVNAVVGDTVIVGIPEDALLKGSLVMYAVPVIGMLLFALLADFALAVSVESRDLMIAVSAIMGLAFGSLISKSYFQRPSNIQLFSPVVLRKIIGHGKL